MPAILTDLSTPALISAIEDNIAALGAAMSRAPGAERCDDDELCWVLTGAPFAIFNAVSRARFAADEADARIAATLALLQERGVPLLWYTGPSTRPADLGQRLVARGFRHSGDDPGMALDLRTLPAPVPLPDGLVIGPVRDLEALRTWWTVAAIGSGFDATLDPLDERVIIATCLGSEAPCRAYVATLDGIPAATALLAPGGGVAGIYSVATLPHLRCRGLGAAVTLAALRDAQAQGYHAAVLQASEMGHPIYLRLGFRAYCTIGFYTWHPGTAC